MFYVKEKLSDSAEINIEIHDENVFCRCPKCGCEVPVDLADKPEVFQKGTAGNVFERISFPDEAAV